MSATAQSPTDGAVLRGRAGTPAALRWRLILDGPRSGAENMARDHALAACLRDGEGVVRLYGWSRPTVSFGKNEPATRPGPGVDHVRRPTGGRAVLHDDEVTYAVVAPLDAFGGLREAYSKINHAIAVALRSLGADVYVAEAELGRSAVRPLDAGACFLTPAPGEVVAAGRKLVGSAQARLEGVLLQHGSILLGGDQRALAGTGTNPVTLRELLGEVSREVVADATGRALRYSFGGSWNDRESDAEYRTIEVETAERLETERYGRDEWTWRR